MNLLKNDRRKHAHKIWGPRRGLSSDPTFLDILERHSTCIKNASLELFAKATSLAKDINVLLIPKCSIPILATSHDPSQSGPYSRVRDLLATFTLDFSLIAKK